MQEETAKQTMEDTVEARPANCGSLLMDVSSKWGCRDFLAKIVEEEDAEGRRLRGIISGHIGSLAESNPGLAATLSTTIAGLIFRHECISLSGGFILGQTFQPTNPETIAEIQLLKARMRKLIPRIEKGEFERLSEKDSGQMDYKERFLEFCRYQRGLSLNAIRNYEWDLRNYFAWLNRNGIQLTAIRVKEIDDFLVWLRQKGSGVATVNRHMYSLKSFYRWLLRMELIQRNHLEAFENIRGAKKLPKYLTSEQQQALLEAARGTEHSKKPWLRDSGRDSLLILLLLDTGIRVAEACSLTTGDINLETGILRVTGKGDKQRECVISARLRSAIENYLRVIDGKGSPEGYLLFNRNKGAIATRVIFRLIRELGKRAGIPGLSPHCLRHTFASNLRKWGADLLLIKEVLGHSSVNTTQIYSHLGIEDQRKRVKDLIDGQGQA